MFCPYLLQALAVGLFGRTDGVFYLVLILVILAMMNQKYLFPFDLKPYDSFSICFHLSFQLLLAFGHHYCLNLMWAPSLHLLQFAFMILTFLNYFIKFMSLPLFL